MSQSFRLVVGLFVGIYIARVIGPYNYGNISFALSVLGFLLPLILFGQQSVFPRLFHTKFDTPQNLLISSLYFTLILSFVVFLLSTAIFFLFVEFNNDNLSIFLVLSSLLFIVKDIYNTFYVTISRGKVIFYVTVLSLTTISVIRLAFVKSPDDLIKLAMTYPIEYLLIAVTYFFFTKHNKKGFDKKVLLKNWNKFISDGWPLILSGLSLSINQRVDQLFLKWKLGFETVGYYAASVKIVEIITIAPYLIARGIFPYFIKLFQKDKEIYYFQISIAYKVAFVLGIIVGIIIYFFSAQVINITYGEGYNNSIIFLKIYAISIPFSFIGAINSLHLKVEARYKSIMGRQFVNLILNLLMNFILISKLGAVGAAYSTLIALINSTIIYDLLEYKKTNINKLKFYVLKNPH